MNTNLQAERYSPAADRRGSGMTELLVAATLLLTGISLVMSVSFRTGKLWQDSRHHDLALQELTNQLELLTTKETNELESALAALEVSDAVKAALPNPKLSGRLHDDDFGARIELTITWERLGDATPLSLVAWLAPEEVP